jgi:hypothetical protein
MIGEPEEDLRAGEGLGGEEGLHEQADGKADGIGDRTCAAGATLKGIDVSKYQGTIDWEKVKASGIELAFIRVSDGVSAIDPQLRANWANAKAAGVKRGVYQFFRPSQDPVAQANRVINALDDLDENDLPPVIDVEATAASVPRPCAHASRPGSARSSRTSGAGRSCTPTRTSGAHSRRRRHQLLQRRPRRPRGPDREERAPASAAGRPE